MTDQAPPEWHDPIPGRHYGDAYKRPVSRVEADRRAVRSFWRGVAVGTALAWLAFCFALAVMA